MGDIVEGKPERIAKATSLLREACHMALLENDCFDMRDVLNEALARSNDLVADRAGDDSDA